MSQTKRHKTTDPIVLDLQRRPGEVEIDLLIPEALYYCQGHFPGFPVLPGVVQLHWAITFGRRHFALGDAPPQSVQVKFKNIISPGERIRMLLSYAAARGRLSFECRDDVAVRSSGTAVFPLP